MTTEPIDPQAIIAEGVRVAARHQRQRDLILGTIMIAAGVALGLLGILGVNGTIMIEASELVFGMFGLAFSMLFVGAIKLARGLHPG